MRVRRRQLTTRQDYGMNVRSRHSPAWLRSGSCVQDVYYKSPVRRFRFHFVKAQKETITCFLLRLKQMIFEMMTWQVQRQRVKAYGFEFYHILFSIFPFLPVTLPSLLPISIVVGASMRV